MQIAHAADKANQTPFLVFMHARYDQYYIENLSALREWSSGEETIYTRKLLIVDEAPNLMKVSKLSTSVIAACEGMISTYKPSYELSWDKPKQTLLSTLNYSLRIPFQKLLRQYKANGSRIARQHRTISMRQHSIGASWIRSAISWSAMPVRVPTKLLRRSAYCQSSPLPIKSVRNTN